MPATSIRAYNRLPGQQRRESLSLEEFQAAIRNPLLRAMRDNICSNLGWYSVEGIEQHVHLRDAMSAKEIRLFERHAHARLLMELCDIVSLCRVADHLLPFEPPIRVYFEALALHYMAMGVSLSEEQTVRLIEHYRWRREDTWGIALQGHFMREMPDRMEAIDAFIKVVSPWVVPSPLRFWRRPGKAHAAFMRLVEDPRACKYDLPEINRLRAVVGLPEVEPLVDKVYTPESAVAEVRGQIREIRACCLAEIARLADERPNETFYALAIDATWFKADSVEAWARLVEETAARAKSAEVAERCRATAARGLAAGAAFVPEEINPGDWDLDLELIDLSEPFPALAELNDVYFHHGTREPAGRFHARIMNDLVRFIAASDEVKRLKRTDGFTVFWSKDLD
ncbi:MAG: hypothetical protein ABTQ29_00710 [Siculibacillus sp.]